MRRCVVTNESFPKKELLRIVKNKEGIVSVDTSGRANGKGAYIKKDLAVLEMAKKKNALGRALETTISDDIYAQIERVINEG